MESAMIVRVRGIMVRDVWRSVVQEEDSPIKKSVMMGMPLAETDALVTAQSKVDGFVIKLAPTLQIIVGRYIHFLLLKERL